MGAVVISPWIQNEVFSIFDPFFDICINSASTKNTRKIRRYHWYAMCFQRTSLQIRNQYYRCCNDCQCQNGLVRCKVAPLSPILQDDCLQWQGTVSRRPLPLLMDVSLKGLIGTME